MAGSTPAENKALVRRYLEEVVNNKDFDVFEESLASDIVAHGVPGSEEGVTGRDAYEAYARGMRESFPDISLTIEAIVAEDDLVATRSDYTATHEGELMGIPATGEKVSFDGFGFFRIEDGKIAELWARTDTLGLLQQLGIIEAPGE